MPDFAASTPPLLVASSSRSRPQPQQAAASPAHSPRSPYGAVGSQRRLVSRGAKYNTGGLPHTAPAGSSSVTQVPARSALGFERGVSSAVSAHRSPYPASHKFFIVAVPPTE
jgi:hypothetical protein